MKPASTLRRAGLLVIALALVASVVLPQAPAAVLTGSALALFAAGGWQLIAWVGSLRAARPAAFERALQPRRTSPDRPPDLESLERTLGWGAYSRRDFDHRVRPLLRRLIAFKLLASRGVDAGAAPEAAARALPPDLRWVLRDDGPADDRATIDTGAIERLVARIEGL